MTDAVDLALAMGALFDQLDVPYAVGGSVAASLFGEPRTTIDIDVAVRLNRDGLAALLGELGPQFYVPASAAAAAVEVCSSFNLVDTVSGLKVDVFVLGASALDRRQIERRWRVEIRRDPPAFLWVTAPEDIVLRKLEWFVLGGETSERQWRDIVGLLRLQGEDLDWDDLHRAAASLGLHVLLQRAIEASAR